MKYDKINILIKKKIFYKMTAMLYFLLFSFVSKNLTNYERRHLKLFTNYHVSWDTLHLNYFVRTIQFIKPTFD